MDSEELIVITFTQKSLNTAMRDKLRAVQATINVHQLDEAELVALVKKAHERLRGGDGTD